MRQHHDPISVLTSYTPLALAAKQLSENYMSNTTQHLDSRVLEWCANSGEYIIGAIVVHVGFGQYFAVVGM